MTVNGKEPRAAEKSRRVLAVTAILVAFAVPDSGRRNGKGSKFLVRLDLVIRHETFCVCAEILFSVL
jgi:hypothetical protein